MMNIKGQHLIIYDEKEIHYITGDIYETDVDTNSIEYEDPLGGVKQIVEVSRTFTFTTGNSIDKDTIKLEETMMRRIAKYNKEKELQKIEEKIKEKEKQIKELDNKLQDKEKRWQRVKEYIANIYDLNLEEDNDDDDYYYFD